MKIVLFLMNIFCATSLFNRIFQRIKTTPFDKLTGFYGLIGPNVNTSKIHTIFDLFTGDGIIQGAFINKGNITFIKHIVRTEKKIYESKHGLFSKNVMMLPFYMLCHKLNIIPNVLGLANTAFMNTQSRTFALFERDYPYEVLIKNNTITTLKKIQIKNINTFSGHSKYDGSHIHSIDYNFIFKRVRYLRMDGEFRQDIIMDTYMKYIPIIHDFAILNDDLLLIDAPFQWNLLQPIPVVLDKKKPTLFHLKNTETKTRTSYTSSESFYLFHYANVLKYPNGTIEIFAPCYDDINFSSLNITGKYRRLILENGRCFIYKNNIFENMNLDFPILWGEYTILRVLENKVINGFVVCKGLDLVKKILLPNNRYFCGEHSVVVIEGSIYFGIFL